MALRRAAVAGTWYSANAERLSAQVAAHLDHASGEPLASVPDGADVVAIVAPHAGLMYSGPVAGYAYRFLRSSSYDVIVLIGPSHYVSFEGASIWPEGAFETPLGNLEIDRDAVTAIGAVCPLIHDLPAAHAREHSLEMQLPFLAVVAPETPIVPIVMGHQTRKTAFELADALSTALAGRRAMLIASSDLSHFYDARTAADLDRQVIARVDALDASGLMSLLETRPDHACGGGPMVTVMRAARALGASTAHVIRYGDSGDVSGDKSSVVGYLAAAAWR
jgi:AmmeMemoRadiSam system protein B